MTSPTRLDARLILNPLEVKIYVHVAQFFSTTFFPSDHITLPLLDHQSGRAHQQAEDVCNSCTIEYFVSAHEGWW